MHAFRRRRMIAGWLLMLRSEASEKRQSYWSQAEHIFLLGSLIAAAYFQAAKLPAAYV
jgi:hypothetical protein